MSDKPRVSVVIPVFNLEEFLGEAIDSVLNQTFGDLEIILVDDGSTDRSREIIARYHREKPDRVQFIFREHAGAAAARNAGIAAASGKWIAFLDGDDAWMPDKLAIQLREIQKDPEINFLSTTAGIRGQSRILPELIPDSQDIKLELLRKGCFITLSSVLIDRELLHDVRFDERLPGAQDLDLYLRLPDRIRYRFIPEPLVIYRIRNHAISDPQTTRFAQLGSHYRIVKREAKNMALANSAIFNQHKKELHSVLACLAHDAAYYSLLSCMAPWPSRLRMAWTAIYEDPRRLKNYRFLLQALLPRRASLWLRHGRE